MLDASRLPAMRHIPWLRVGDMIMWTQPYTWLTRDIDRAQGLNNALMDAAKYVDAIVGYRKSSTSRSTCLAAAIDAFDEEVFQRGKREINISAEQGYAATHWEKYLDSPVLKHGHADTARLYHE